MCGIVGAMDLTGRRDFDRARLSRMAKSLRHRGPDDSFAWSEPGIAMATQRLAIRGGPEGRQPLSDAAGRIWVSYNGELFNHDELEPALVRRGHVLRTSCDTELWPYLYLEHGKQAFEHAQGQFALALWDRAERRLLLGRDRVGICPLFYASADGWLVWASEIKAILAAELVPVAADPLGIDNMFSLFASGPRRTCFRGIHALLPGHYIEAQAGELEERRYWDLSFPADGEERRSENPATMAEELGACLERAVRRRLVADAGVATYLSGGIDSALIAALARRHATVPIPAFSIGFEREGPDERVRSARTARALDIPLDTLVPTAEAIVEALPEAVLAAESPILDMANTCLLLLARRVAAQNCKVVLTGEGADEALAGYFWHKTRRLFSARGVRALAASLFTPGTRATPLGGALGGLRPSQLELYELLARARSLFYSTDMAHEVRDYDPFAELDFRPEQMRSWHPLNQSLYLEYKLMLPGHLLLGKGDRVGMRSSVENRYPFLDEEFVTLCAGLAPEYKLRGFSEKWILRRAAARILPPGIARHPKTMFKAKSLCALGARPRFIDQLTSPDSLRATGYFSPERVARERRLQRLLPSLSPRRVVLDASYTAVVTTQLWHHLFLGGGLCELGSWSAPD